MNLKIAYFLLFGYLCAYQIIFCVPTITFFIRSYPEVPQEISPEKLVNQLAAPGKLSAKAFKNNVLKNEVFNGIFSTYFGYLALSDFTGKVTFPRRTIEPSFKLLITQSIIPITMIGNTIHHWEINPAVPTELYTIERKQDSDTKAWFWQVQKGNLPKNNIITLDTIVLFAKPEKIYVPEGITLTDNNPQLFLPNIYAKKGLNIPARALWVLTVKHLFGSIPHEIKKYSDTYFSRQLRIK
jgi:hypothetical protein